MMLDDDVLGLILRYASLDPKGLVTNGRVNRQWRRVTRVNAQQLVLNATPRQTTKKTVMGLYALDCHEADMLPHVMLPRRGGGVRYMYTDIASHAWRIVGSPHAWDSRLAARAAKQAAIERAFGEDWRRTRWIPYHRRLSPIRPLA